MTIADVLLGVGFEESSSSPLANDQRRATIVGLVNLIHSAQELLKSNHISEDEYAMLLGATFSRHFTMELVFDLFRSCVYHLVMEGKEKAKIGKSIILHCINNLMSCESASPRGQRHSGEGSTYCEEKKVIGTGCADKPLECFADTIHFHFPNPVSKDEGLRNTQGSNMWRGESDRGDRERDYVEVFLELMDESDYFDPFQKNALLKFGIAYEYQAKTLYQASFRAA